MSYALPIEQPIASGGYVFCDGPLAIGNTTIQVYQDRWIAWVASTGIRISKWSEGLALSDAAGVANTLFTAGEKPSRFGFAFEQDALYGLAYNTAPDTITLRRLVSGVVTSYTWTGRSPLLFYNGVLVADTSVTDLMAFYIKAAGDKIFCRVQRENFAVEHEWAPTLHTTLRELRKTDRVLIDGVNYQAVWAITTDGRQAFYLSQAYPPLPEYNAEPLAMDVSLAGGVLEQTIVAVTGADQSSMDVSAAGGTYESSTVTTFSPGEQPTMNVAFESGIYLTSIIPGPTTPENAAMDVAFEGGSYTLTAIPTGAPPDNGTMDVGFSGGSYL